MDTPDKGRVQVLVRVPHEVRLRLRIDAARHDRSMSEHVAALLDEHLPAAEPSAVG